MLVLAIICIIIFSILTFVGLLLLLAVGPASGGIVVLAIGALLLAASIYGLINAKKKRKSAAGNEWAADHQPQGVSGQPSIRITITKADGKPSGEITGRYCPYCGSEFDGGDEICPSCGARTKKLRPEEEALS